MFIELPKEYYFENSNIYVNLEKGILKIKFKGDNYSFRKIMYDITFKMKGHTCCYCGSEKDITIDHIHPRSRGGPTITNNLQPACKSCNVEKDGLNDIEYKFFLRLEPEERKEFKKDVREASDIMSKWNGFYKEMPQEWFVQINIQKIKAKITKSGSKQIKSRAKYNKIKKNYKISECKEYIVLDRNNVLLHGVEMYCIAKSLNLRELPVIKLENVEIVF